MRMENGDRDDEMECVVGVVSVSHVGARNLSDSWCPACLHLNSEFLEIE